MQDVLFFRGSSGLNTKVSPARLRYDQETGVQELSEAVNVDIDQTGRVSRRRGLRRILRKSSPHSFWNIRSQQACYFVADNTLYRMVPGVIAGVKTGISNSPAYYCEVGNDVYFSNGTDLGILRDGETWEDWEQTPYIGPNNTREYSGPPLGSSMCHYNGRIYVAQGEFLLCSEPFNYGCFDLGRNFLPISGSQIIDLASVENGIYVSTNDGVYFLSGSDFLEMGNRKVADRPAVKGSMSMVESSMVNPEIAGTGAVFCVQGMGIVFGTGDGQVRFLTRDRLDVPAAQYGFAAVNSGQNNEYICFMEV